MKQSLPNKATTKISSMLIEITAAIGATVAIAVGVPCVACYMLIERHKRRRDMEGIHQDIKVFLKQHSTNTK
jgi:hypothetical protein